MSSLVISGLLTKNYNNGVKMLNPIRRLTLIQRIFIWILNKLSFDKLSDKYLINWNWFDGICLDNYDTVVVFDVIKNYHFLCKKIEALVNEDSKLILYLWNPISRSNDYKNISKRWKKCSFSKKDAEIIEGFFVDSFYANSNILPFKIINYDFFFVGLDKGRMDLIEKLSSKFRSQGYKCKFLVVDNIKRMFNKKYVARIPYDKVRAYISESRCLLDIVQEGQTGCTQRVFEALFNRKKLLTNMSSIKHSEIYNPNNIFILGEDDLASLKIFMDKPFIDYPKEVLYRYTFSGWLQRINSI